MIYSFKIITEIWWNMSAKNAANRVKEALKNKASVEVKESNSLLQSHQCNQVKFPRMPSALSHLFPLLAKKLKEKKARSVSLPLKKETIPHEVTDCAFEQVSLPGLDLIPARVKRWQLKEYHLIVLKIKTLSQYNKPSSKHDITLLSNSPLENSQDELWEEMIKTKEERQFQLGRITRYFS